MKKSCWSILKIAPYSSREEIVEAYGKLLEEKNFENDIYGIEEVKNAYHEALNANRDNLDLEDEEELIINGEQTNNNEGEEKKIFSIRRIISIIATLYVLIKLIMSLIR